MEGVFSMKRLLAVLVVLLSASLNVSLVRSQEDGCVLDLAEANKLLADAQTAYDTGDIEAALKLVSQAEALLGLTVEHCGTWAPENAGESRANPVPLGQRQSIDEGRASIEIKAYVPEANDIVMEANSLNDKPTQDQRYIVVEFTYYCELELTESCEYEAGDFSVVGSRGVVYDALVAGFPLDAEVFGGGQVTVQRAFLVGIDESSFQLFFSTYGGTRVFFAVQ
jgi:hypothetical protein